MTLRKKLRELRNEAAEKQFGKQYDQALGVEADEGPHFDSTDVEVEKQSDAVFDTLSDDTRREYARIGAAFTVHDKLPYDVRHALERRCRAWYAANTPEGT